MGIRRFSGQGIEGAQKRNLGEIIGVMVAPSGVIGER